MKPAKQRCLLWAKSGHRLNHSINLSAMESTFLRHVDTVLSDDEVRAFVRSRGERRDLGKGEKAMAQRFRPASATLAPRRPYHSANHPTISVASRSGASSEIQCDTPSSTSNPPSRTARPPAPPLVR
jgi:hypothetical protein